jgi:hypothetical protein
MFREPVMLPVLVATSRVEPWSRMRYTIRTYPIHCSDERAILVQPQSLGLAILIVFHSTPSQAEINILIRSQLLNCDPNMNECQAL